MRCREELEKFSLSYNVKLYLKFSVEYYWSPNNFEQTQVAPRWPNSYKSGAPNVNFRKISVRKTIWDLEFSEHLL